MGNATFLQSEKEQAILQAAKTIFFSSGFQQATMDEIAKKAGCSKVTVYAYFQSKENLYMAITYDAFLFLADLYYQAVEEQKSHSGLDSLMAIAESYLDFCINHTDYSKLIMDYRMIIRDSLSGVKMSKISQAMQDSIYYRKIRDIQYLPIKIAVEEIMRGQQDGSIPNAANPWLVHHLMWSNVVGFAQLYIDSQTDTFINTKVTEWKSYILRIIRAVCEGKV